MSHLTYRKKVDVCWQKLLRDKYLSEGVPDVADLKVKNARVRKISRSLARQIILKYEWLGTMSNTSEHFGIFYGDHCAGVTCVAVNGTGTAGNLTHMRFKIDRKELTTLARGACTHWAPPGSNSKLVAWTCKLLGNGNRIILAYSDSDAGEIGTIYQACNWFYIGNTHGEEQLIAPSGRIINHHMLGYRARQHKTTKAHIRKKLIAIGWKTEMGNAKGRYCQVLDKKDKALLGIVRSLSKPYPKRAAAIKA